MSWSVNAEIDTRSPNWTDVVYAMKPTSVDPTEEQNHQVKSAAYAIVDLISSGSLGTDGRCYSVLVNGHANPGHRPQEGWANDMINISINQMPTEGPSTEVNLSEFKKKLHLSFENNINPVYTATTENVAPLESVAAQGDDIF